MENIIVWGGIITMNLLFVFISPILDSLSDNENREKLEKKWLKAFIIILIVSKIITYYINEYEIDSQLIFDFINGNLKFLFNKGENPIISLIEIIVNISQSLEIYLGVISVLVAIYIYLIGLNDDFKKYVLLTLLGEGRPLYLTVFLLILYFFNVSPILFIGLNIVVFYELYNMIKETFKITNNGYFKTNWDKEIINQLLKIRNIKALENMYYEIRKKIMKAILEKDFILLEETIFYYQELLMADSLKEIPEDYILPFEKIDNKKQEDFQENINLPKEFKNSVTNSEQERIERKENYERNTLVIREMKKAVRFLYKIYKLLIKEPDNNLFEEISDVNLVLGKYYLEKQEYSTARAYFDFLKLKYKYLKNNEVYSKEIKELYLFSGLRYYETYYEKLSEEQEIIILKSILNLFNEMVENDDIEDILRYQEIFTRKREEVDMILLKEYTRLLLIFLLEKKRTKSKKETEIKNIINSIE
ncbi:MAG: hypothetical protein SO183_00795, partial [Fusobacterium mortiferum]|nr:hypothetical protein [Fusobacterium mortiferum]